MKVAIDARYVGSKGSGISRYTSNLIRHMLGEEPNLRLLLIRHRFGLEPVTRDSRVEETVFPAPPNSLRTLYLLGLMLRRQDFDIFHGPFNLLPFGIRTPAVLTVHDIMWILNPHFISHNFFMRTIPGTFYGKGIESSMVRADRIITDVQASRASIIDRYPWLQSRLRVIHLGAEDSSISIQEEKVAWAAVRDILPPNTPFVMVVGNASPHKNHLNALKGFLKAFKNRPEYRLVMVRRFLRQDREMNRLLKSPDARRQVITLPHISEKALRGLYNTARILLQPSYYEGFGFPVLEAMACKTPVVTSNVSCLPEVSGEAALHIDPGEPLAIAKALQRLDSDEKLRQQLLEKGLKRVKEFTWKRCASQTLSVYRELI